MKYSKKSFLLLAMLFVAQVSMSQHSLLSINKGDSLLLTKVCTSNQQVLINGVFRTKGFRFTIDNKIELKNGEYIKVTNLNTGVPDIIISGNDLIKTKTSTIGQFIQVRGVAGKGTDDFGDFLDKFTWYIIEDTLYIPTNYLLDNRHAFFLKTIPGNKLLPPIPYDFTTNELVLTNDYFINNDIHLTPEREFQFRVEYWEGHDKVKVITDKLFIEYIPNF